MKHINNLDKHSLQIQSCLSISLHLLSPRCLWHYQNNTFMIVPSPFSFTQNLNLKNVQFLLLSKQQSDELNLPIHNKIHNVK